MKRKRGRYRRYWLFGILALPVGLLVFGANMSLRTSDVQTKRYFAKRNTIAHIRRVPFAGGELRYVETGLGADTAPVVLFVHGAPGSGNNFYRYLADSILGAKARLISMDRPGYGYSNYGISEPRFAGQAAAVKAVLDQYKPTRTILVGHSFGGPVIAQAALDYPGQVDALLLLAPVNDPDSEPVPWYANFARWRATRWMLSKAWQVSGDEKFAHIEELRKLQPRWNDLRIPVIHLHGESDFLAPPEGNIAFSRQHIPAAYLKMKVMPKSSHFIPWTDYEAVREELNYFINYDIKYRMGGAEEE